jgi:hypothetical protein
MKNESPLLYKLIDDSIKIKSIPNPNNPEFPFYPFTINYPIIKACICISTNNSRAEQPGYIIHDAAGNLIFVPTIHKKLLYLYLPITSGEIVYFSDIGCSMEDITSKILYKYTKRKLNPINTIVCYRK